MKKVFNNLIFFVFLTQSIDIVFNLSLGGFNIRTCYLAAFAYLFLFISTQKNPFSFRFLGLSPFLVWVAFLVVFVGNTQLLTRNIGYLMWLAFNVLAIWAIVQHAKIGAPKKILRLYLLSFFCMAIFGIAQFFLSSIGLNFFVTMWWRAGVLPRVNALSYEPSYFASYLLIAFVFLYYATRKKLYFFSKNHQYLMLATMVFAILLSTSRMGILFMVVLLAIDYIKMLATALINLRISKINLIITTFLIGSLFTIFGLVLGNKSLRNQYLAGTGIGSTAGHSKEARMYQLKNTWLIFKESPFIGYSLGGIAPAIAKYYGAETADQKKAKEYEGLNIFLEVLAASGIFGFLFFAIWLFQYFRCQIGMSAILKKNGFSEESQILDCLKYALLAEMTILMLSQNILRPYLWTLIGMGNAFYYSYKDLIFKRSATTLQATDGVA